MNAKQWIDFLNAWQSTLVDQYQISSETWHEYGLAKPDQIECFRSANIGTTNSDFWMSRKNSEDILNFYSVTNGWPLFLGPDGVEIAPIEELHFFHEIGGPWYDLAIGRNTDCPAPALDSEYELSMSEFSSSVVLSRPVSARELILWIESGQICLYTYSSLERFDSLSELMKRALDDFCDLFEEA